jgi:hypothetical protein
MVAAIRQRVTVQSGGVIEIRSAELTPGSEAEVIVFVDRVASQSPAAKLSSFFGAARGVYVDPTQADATIRTERDAWEG